MAAPTPAIECRDLVRTYGEPRRRQIRALDGLTCSVPQGSIFGLLGPNGAGKTTLTKVLSTLLLPTSGTARVLGLDVGKDAQEVRRSLGVVFGGERGLYLRVSALDNLLYAAALYGLPSRRARERAGAVLEQFGLVARATDKVETYSRGMRQRLHLCRAMLHEPKMLLLDEPTAGLDPEAARDLRTLIHGLAADRTVLLTTHYLLEADELCDRLIVLRSGRMLAEGTPDRLRQIAGAFTVVELVVPAMDEATSDRLRKVPFVQGLSVVEDGAGRRVGVRVAHGKADLAAITHCFAGSEVRGISVREASLEDAYFSLVTP